MASGKAASRYALCDSHSSVSSALSSTSSSAGDPRLCTAGSAKFLSLTEGNGSRVLARAQSAGVPYSTPVKSKNEQNFTSLVKRFIERKAKPSKAATPPKLVIPADIIASDLKKTAAKASRVSNLHRKFFEKASDHRSQTKKALPEGKENTRTLAMVLKSERDLMSRNKEYEMEIEELKGMLVEKNDEVVKLKDVCLRQREEIRALKSSILLPDISTLQLEKLLEKQGLELRHAREVIPNLQEQVSSLTGQIRSLAEGLAEVKAEKYGSKDDFDGFSSWPATPGCNEEAANSLEFSSGPSGEPASPGSPSDRILRDMNPCLTPYYAKSKCKDYDEIIGYGAPCDYFENKPNMKQKQNLAVVHGKLSKSPECPKRHSLGGFTRLTSKSDGSKSPFGNPTLQRLF
ncbi:hypothetical protein EJ110_NYTH29422 [Nymphaea thermarum]|nr:hypothetical protein EJ110_NYTH29422 [Nymphaea thermarum]